MNKITLVVCHIRRGILAITVTSILLMLGAPELALQSWQQNNYTNWTLPKKFPVFALCLNKCLCLIALCNVLRLISFQSHHVQSNWRTLKYFLLNILQQTVLS